MTRLALLAWLALPVAVSAQDRPLLLPARDVDVTYDTPAENGLLQQRLRWDVADRLLRVDPPVTGLYMIVSYGDDRMSVVRTQDRSVLRIAAPPSMIPGSGAGAFTRLADDRVAGLSCTEWRTTDSGGLPTEICVTADGVLLRARGDGRVLLQASRVDYAAQPPPLFQTPDGFRLLTPPP